MYKNTHPKHQRPGGRRDSQERDSARSARGRQRHLSVRGELRDTPDLRRIARAIIDMELARMEAEARAATQATDSDTEESSDG